MVDSNDHSHDVSFLTPQSQQIYNASTTTDKKYLLEDFRKDDSLIDQIKDKNDPDYLYDDTKPDLFGFFIESWVTELSMSNMQPKNISQIWIIIYPCC